MPRTRAAVPAVVVRWSISMRPSASRWVSGASMLWALASACTGDTFEGGVGQTDANGSGAADASTLDRAAADASLEADASIDGTGRACTAKQRQCIGSLL